MSFPWSEANPQVHSGFDRNLLYVNERGSGEKSGQVVVGEDEIRISAVPGSQPTVHLVTSDSSFVTEFDVTIFEESPSIGNSSQPSYPLLVKLWHPQQGNEVSLWFESGPLRQVKAGVATAGKIEQTEILTPYQEGTTYRVRTEWQKRKSFELAIWDSSGQVHTCSINKESAVAILQENIINLSVFAQVSPDGEGSQAAMRNFELIIPPKTRLATHVSDWRLLALTSFIVLWLVSYLLRRYTLGRAIRALPSYLATVIRQHRRETIAVGITLVLVFVGYLAASTCEGHPFDRLSIESWSYISAKYGLGSLYARSNAVPSAIIFGGFPGDVPGYAYPPLFSYHYYLLGKIYSAISPSFEIMRSTGLMVFIKSSFGIFILLGGLAIYTVSRRLSASSKLAYGLMLLYILNPAIIFDGMVWGESDSVLIFFLFLSATSVVLGKSKMVWIFLAISLLLKQTAIIAAPVIALLAFRQFGLRRTLHDAGLALVIAFALLSPLIFSGYHPSVMYTPTVVKFVDFAAPAGEHGMPISWDTYNLWTLFTGCQEQHGWGRLFYPDFQSLPFIGITYSAAAKILFGLVLFGIVILLFRKHPHMPNYPAFLVLATILLAFVVLSTRVLGRYYTLGIPFLIMSYFCVSGVFTWPSLIIVSAISSITMYGSLMQFGIDKGWLSFILDPSRNRFGATIQRAYINDFTITACSALAVIGLVYLLIVSRRDLLLEDNVKPD